MRSPTLFARSPGDNVFIPILRQNRLRILSVSFSWTIGALLAGNEHITAVFDNSTDTIWRADIPLIAAAGTCVMAVGSPEFMALPVSFNPATGVYTYAQPFRTCQRIPDMWVEQISSPQIILRSTNTALAAQLVVAYETEDSG